MCDFFSKFFSRQGHPLKFFDILQQTEVSKSPKGLPFKFFGTMRRFQNSHFSFSKIFYSLQRVPLHFFDILQQTGLSKSPKGPSFYNLKTLRFLSLRYSADFRRSRLVWTNFGYISEISVIRFGCHCARLRV